MAFTTRDGVSLHYQVHGSAGEAVVLLHGYTGRGSDWRYQVEVLQGEHRVLVMDNRGHGESDAPPDTAAYTVEHMTEDALHVLAQIGFDRFHLVGHSIGGAVAQEIALRAPGRLLTLTLADTTHWFGDHDQPGGTRPFVPPVLAEMSAQRIAAMSKAALRGGWRGLLAWGGSTDRVHEVEAPMLVVYGERDASRIVEGSQRICELNPRATVAVIAGAGHSPHLERPQAFNAVLHAHLGDSGT